MSDFNSQHWFPLIKRLANKYYEYSDKNFISYDEKNVDVIEHKYRDRMSAVKSEIYNSNDLTDNRINRYKIISLYIQAFLENPIFTVANKSQVYPTWNTFLINEFFCLDIMRCIFTDWLKIDLDNNKFIEKYEGDFLKLLYNYKERKNLNLILTIAIAHIIGFIEQNYCE
jgi:hypothetical protein